MQPEDEDQPLSENEAALFAAISAIIRSIPIGRQRKMLTLLLSEAEGGFLVEKKPQAAALLSLLASLAGGGLLEPE
jgi:hypothetical protein